MTHVNIRLLCLTAYANIRLQCFTTNVNIILYYESQHSSKSYIDYKIVVHKTKYVSHSLSLLLHT